MTLLLLALLQSPAASLGFEPGTDSMLADWPQVSGYLSGLAQRSPYVRVDTLGRTTEGRPFLLLTITSPANQARLAAIKRGRSSSPTRACSPMRCSPSCAPPSPRSS